MSCLDLLTKVELACFADFVSFAVLLGSLLKCSVAAVPATGNVHQQVENFLGR